MEQAETADLIARIERAFGSARNVTPAPDQPLHVLMEEVVLPDAWSPNLTRALVIWEGWPEARPRFLIDEQVRGESGEPPRSNDLVYVLGEGWRQFSFSFPWVGDDPVVAVQKWLERFSVESS